MFCYPPKAFFNKVMPKNKIYGFAKPSRSVQDKFISQVEQLVWAYKLAPETINLPPRGFVQEIEIFQIFVKEQNLSEDVLLTIDKAVVHPVFFQLHFGDKIRCVAAQKRASEADSGKWVVSDYFSTGWESSKAPLLPLPVALDLNALSEDLLRAHIALKPRPVEPLRQLVDRACLIKQKEREAARLEADLQRERQFNRKVEINAQLRDVTSELSALYLS
jgi:hypothetical protein